MPNTIDPYGHVSKTAESVHIDTVLIRKFDKSGPRYSSYPAADRFIEAYNARSHQTTLEQRGITWGPNTRVNARPFSLYVHIPFCGTVCHYCSCNKIITRDHSRATRYLRAMDSEFALVANMLTGDRRADQVHLGGGTPTFLSIDELQTMMRSLRNHFELLPGERAIEIDPRTVDDEKIAALVQLGFDHISLGVQDFDPAVQKAVNRIQSEEQTASAVESARKHGVTSITIDLIHGLPRQNVIGFNRTLDRVLALKPDRIALYNYSHQPAMFKTQRRIDAAGLPDAATRLQIMTLAIRKLADAKYDYVGLDHFALAHDKLSTMARHARLHSDFQGYSTRLDNDLLAFGVSAISRVGTTYSQNVKTLDEYYDRLDRAELPVWRGIELCADDLLRRAVIQSLMCHFELSIESIEIAHLIDFRDYFADEWERLEGLECEGLVTLEPAWISITPRGRQLAYSIAVIFDRYTNRDEQRVRSSSVI